MRLNDLRLTNVMLTVIGIVLVLGLLIETVEAGSRFSHYRSEWIRVGANSFGGSEYDYLKIRGGWLVHTVAGGAGSTWEGGLTFIPDPEHKTPPLPVE